MSKYKYQFKTPDTDWTDCHVTVYQEYRALKWTGYESRCIKMGRQKPKIKGKTMDQL
jgi:hypothetical protein